MINGNQVRTKTGGKRTKTGSGGGAEQHMSGQMKTNRHRKYTVQPAGGYM